jgi:PKHD-type hydroxylase
MYLTSGAGAALAKHNRQLPENSPAAAHAQGVVLRALAGNGTFLSAALPHAIYPPLFNRYGVGEGFGDHVDNAIRVNPQTGMQMRTDLSATLFLSEDYDGGELTIDADFGGGLQAQRGRYGALPLHQPPPGDVGDAGERIACFFWLQSLVRDGAAREALFDIDQSVQTLSAQRGGDDAEVLRLTKAYHNLIRFWSM